MFRACCSNNKILQTSRKSHGGNILCPVTSRMFPFTAAHILYQRLTLNIDVNECIDVTDATELWAACREHALMFMDEVLGTNKEPNGWCGERATERWKDSFILISTNHKMSLSSCDCLMKRSLWEISFWILLSSFMSWKNLIVQDVQIIRIHQNTTHDLHVRPVYGPPNPSTSKGNLMHWAMLEWP